MALLYVSGNVTGRTASALYHGCLREPQSQKTRWVVLVLINLTSLACLVWALRDLTWPDLRDDIATINYGWVALAGGIELCVYLTQAVRWRLVLRPVVSLKFRQAVRAIYVGLFASEILPFRGGEAVRNEFARAVPDELVGDLHHPIGAALGIRRHEHVLLAGNVIAKGILSLERFPLAGVRAAK